MNITKEQVENLIDEVLERTRREVIRYELSPAEGLPVTDSKVGGVPYIPKEGSLPKTSDGKPLFMIAQINCEQLPENNFYPKTGLLQFWIRIPDKKYVEEYNQGLRSRYESDDPFGDDSRRVLYYPTLTEATPFENFQAEYHFYDGCMPLKKSKEFAMHFTKDTEVVSSLLSCYHPIFIEKWNEKFGTNLPFLYGLSDEADEALDDFLPNGQGNKLGGYGEEAEYGNYSTEDFRTFPLLQIDCDDELGIDWVEGVGIFLIKEEELAECDFTEVYYNFQF
jgi:hypothetical protein